MKSLIAAIALTLGVSSCSSLALAGEPQLFDKIETNGMFFKDSIEEYVIDDPDVKGVSCYVTMVVIPYSFEDPTDSSIACRQVGPISGTPSDKETVFEANKNAFFKIQEVRRKYDKVRNVLVYTSYVKKTGGKNHAHAISVVPLGMK